MKTIALLLAMATAAMGQTNIINYCSSMPHSHESVEAQTYMIPILLGTPKACQITEVSFFAWPHTNGPSPTVRLAIYTNFTALRTLGAHPSQVPPLFYREYTTNNGMIMVPIDPNRVATNCLENTNLFIIHLPLKVNVPAGNYLAIWFPPKHLNWQIPPYFPPTGMGGITKVYQSCRYTLAKGGYGYYCQPLSLSGYYDIPYGINFRPQLAISLQHGTSGNSIQISWPETNATNLTLRTGNHIIATVTNVVTIKANAPAEMFWLEQ
jgi:hypothetical protein